MPTFANAAPRRSSLVWLMRGRLAAARLVAARPVAVLLLAGLVHFLIFPMPFAQAQGPDELNKKVHLPLAPASPTATSSCPDTGGQYQAIPVLPPRTDRPAERHGDLNLNLRGSSPTAVYLGLVDYGGATDPDAPQLRAVFADHRIPLFSSAHRVYDWNWACGADGCRGAPITSPPVTLLGMATAAGEPVLVPGRSAEIYGGGYLGLVLYAEERRVTIKYTRDDNVRSGYTIHVENVCVDPKLLALYRSANAAGRGSLPALRGGQPIGTAAGGEIRVAVRDTGAFLDPRSRKDWWQR